MIKLTREKIFSAPGVFIIYILASWILIQTFRFIVPGEAAPLEHFSMRWRFLRGFIEFLKLYPSLSLSALVLPFGFTITPAEKLSAFSPRFLQSLRGSIFTVIAAAGIYGLLFLLVLPEARNYESSLRNQGKLYRLAERRALEQADLGEWNEAGRFIDICERIWPRGPEIEKLRTDISIMTEGMLYARSKMPSKNTITSSWPNLPNQEALNATEALAMAETAMKEERYYDAHWLATLAGRLAGPGSAEIAAASRTASLAWNAVNSLEPNSRESEAYRIYNIKRDGYEALMNEDWIRAYYIFLELKSLSPSDPDADKYFRMSEQGCASVAFFIDEIEMSLGNNLSWAVFSLPQYMGRMVMRLSSLMVYPDSAYGIGMELLVFDRDAGPTWRIEAPYVKMLPLAIDSEVQVSLLCRAIDRNDKTKQWEPIVVGLGENPPSTAQFILDVGWEDFLLLAELHHGMEDLPVGRLLAASKFAGNYGYLPQVFEAGILNRFVHPFFFLALAVVFLVAGWRYRAQKWPRYIFVPMIGILPLVSNGVFHFFRAAINNAGVWAVFTFGFGSALVIFGAGVTILVVASLILLAAQHG